MAQPDPNRLAFDDVVIDLPGRRLWRGGEEQPLEPKAFGVLAVLTGSPGRVFARDEILDVVWGHRHVTPGVLNRVMTLLRHALGEEAHTPRYLHTVHAVGYRFDLPPAATSGPVIEAVTGIEPAPSPFAGAVPMRRVGDRAPSSRKLLWLLPLFAMLALSTWKLWPRSEPAAAVAATAPARTPEKIPTLVVMPLKPIGEDSSVRTLADGLSEELICSLARIDGLRVISRESTRLLGADDNLGAQTQRLGITHALEGNLQQSGQRLRVRLRMIETGNGGLLWARDFDRDATEALALQRDIAETVASSLSLRLGLSDPVALGGDADFQRRFLGARVLAMSFDLPVEASVEKAEAELRALLRERPDDARSHAWLALALSIRGNRQPGLRPELAAETVREAMLALRLDPSRYEPYLVLAAEDCRHQRWEPCIARLDRAQALAPGLVHVHASQAVALARLGYLDRAEAHAREAVAVDPLNTFLRGQLARLLDVRGKHDEAARHFQLAEPYALHGRWFNAVWRNDAATALRLADEFDAGTSVPVSARFGPVAIAVARARTNPALWPQARSALERDEREHPGRSQFAGVLDPDATAQADVLASQLAAAQTGDDWYSGMLLWATDLAFLRRTPAFQRYLRDSGILGYWTKHGFPEQCRLLGDGVACA